MGWTKKVIGLSNTNKQKNKLRHRQQYGNYKRERGVGWDIEEGKGGTDGDGRRLDFEW